MTGLEVALLAFAVFCLALLIVALGSVDDLRDRLARERALARLRAISDNPKDMT